jgi:chromosome segregation ATPase
MVDPTGTAGLPRRGADAAPETDLGLAVMGGPKFLDRLKQLADASDRHEHAFAMLKLGEDILAQRADAQQKLAAADAKRAEAQAVLDKANADADALMVKAGQVKKDADSYASDKQCNADAVLASAKDELAKAHRLQSQAEAMIEKYNAAKAEAEGATKAANDRRDVLQSKLDQLHKIVADASR